MAFDKDELVQDFKREAKRQKSFTNSFWRQLLVIIVAIIIIQLVGPYVINLSSVQGDLLSVAPGLL